MKREKARSHFSPKATISHYLAAAKTEPRSGEFPGKVDFFLTDLWIYEITRYLSIFCNFPPLEVTLFENHCGNITSKRDPVAKMFWRWQWEWVTDCANEPLHSRDWLVRREERMEESEISDSSSYAISIFTVGRSVRHWEWWTVCLNCSDGTLVKIP